MKLSSLFADASSFFAPALVLLLCYVCAVSAIVADFISGYNKSKRIGRVRRSYALRQTVPKTVGYLCMLLCTSCMDVVSVFALLAFSVPELPYFTMLGTLFVCFVELKSIREDFSAKERSRLEKTQKQIFAALQQLPREQLGEMLTTFLSAGIDKTSSSTDFDKKYENY